MVGNMARTNDRARVRQDKIGPWIEAPIDADWVAAHRLIIQNGRPVIGEIRVFPRELAFDKETGKWLETRPTPGAWSVEERGVDAEVPLGGITSGVLRGVRMGHHAEILRDYFKASARRLGRPLKKLLDSPFDGLAANPAAGRRGRPATSIQEIARIAEKYVEKVNGLNRDPVRLVAELEGMKVGRVRSMIHRARELGLLTRDAGPRQQGRAGGQLTPRAQALVASLKGESSAANAETKTQYSLRRKARKK